MHDLFLFLPASFALHLLITGSDILGMLPFWALDFDM